MNVKFCACPVNNALCSQHVCPIFVYPGYTVTFMNEKVQRQVGSNDCGLFALAFATDFCHGLDSVIQRYNQGSM